MSFLLPSPPLRRLMALKLKGAARRQLRRLKTPTGALFALLGFGLLLMWLGTTALTVFLGMREPADPAWAQPLARAGLGILWITALTGSLAHRGLYLPPAEIGRVLGRSGPAVRVLLLRARRSLARHLQTEQGRRWHPVGAFPAPPPPTPRPEVSP